MALATAVDTPLDTLDSATPVATTASVRLRLIPTTDTDTPVLATLACGATEDTDSDTAVDTPPLDTLDLATAVDTTEDSATDTPVLEATTASVRLRLSPRLKPMLMLIPTTDTVTPDLATLTAVATDTSDKKVPVLQSAKAFKTSMKQN